MLDFLLWVPQETDTEAETLRHCVWGVYWDVLSRAAPVKKKGKPCRRNKGFRGKYRKHQSWGSPLELFGAKRQSLCTPTLISHWMWTSPRKGV